MSFFAGKSVKLAGFAGPPASLLSRPRWMRPLAAKILEQFKERCSAQQLEEFLAADGALHSALEKEPRPWPSIRRWLGPEPSMHDVSPGLSATIVVPPLATTAALAELLEISPAELAWFSDLRGQNVRASDQRLHHYMSRFVAKRTGGYRLLETPKFRLKNIQRTLAEQFLSKVPASPQAHGFVQGRSIHSFVRPHIGKRVVVRLDLANFFSTIGYAHVKAIFARFGYPQPVAAQLAGLCTTRATHATLGKLVDTIPYEDRFEQTRRLRAAHLPQGAPTSPSLSNLAALSLDRRLTALAAAFGATYTRYADDLAFSGDASFARQVHGFVPHAAAVLMDEGFVLRFSKTRIMFSGQRQHLTGLVINQKTNVVRGDYDRLRALLHQASRTGLDAQNRDGRENYREHILGKIAYITLTNEARGKRLTKLFAKIPRS